MLRTYRIQGTGTGLGDGNATVILDAARARLETEDGKDLGLSVSEIAIMECLCMNAGKPVGATRLQNHVWRRTGREPKTPYSLVVQVSVSKRKLREAGIASPIERVRTVGYVINAPVEARSADHGALRPYKRRNLVFYPSHQQAFINEIPLHLSPQSRRLLTLLATTDGILDNEAIMTHVYGGRERMPKKDPSWMVHALRRQIMDAGGPDPVNVVYGQGYRIWR